MIEIVGGTYRERCAVPDIRLLRGSGLRAAAALSGRCALLFHTAVEEAGEAEAEAVFSGLGVATSTVRRSEPVTFDYFTPVSSPTIDGRMASSPPLDIRTDGAALVFGMLEQDRLPATVRADRLIFDPQQPRDLVAPDWSAVSGGRMAVVANRMETMLLGGGDTVEESARLLCEASGAAATITKLSALGALVTLADDQEHVGPFPSRRVRPLGSGDVFAAAFAYAWGENHEEPVDAARYASWATSQAMDATSNDFAVPEGPPQKSELPAPQQPPQVYLAGPFFSLSERWMIETARSALGGAGATVFSPLHDVGYGDNSVAIRDLRGLEESSAVLAFIDGGDSGTLFECGYATSRGIPVVAYGHRPDSEGCKMLTGTGAELHDDLSTAIYRAVWRAMGSV